MSLTLEVRMILIVMMRMTMVILIVMLGMTMVRIKGKEGKIREKAKLDLLASLQCSCCNVAQSFIS
jgi:hypothetical protein